MNNAVKKELQLARCFHAGHAEDLATADDVLLL
jgi:hypothetical protein